MKRRNRLQLDLAEIGPILSEAERSGVDVPALLDRLGIGQAVHCEVGVKVDLVDYFRIQRDIARALDDLTAHLSERKLIYQTGSFVMGQLKSSHAMLDVMRGLVEYFNMMHGGDYNRLRQSDSSVTLVIDDAAFPYRFRDNPDLVSLVGEALLIKVHCLIDSLCNGQADKALKRVGLRRDRADVRHSLGGFWSVQVSHGKSAYELTYDIDLACQPLPPAQAADISTEGVFARVIRYLETHRPDGARTFAMRTEDLVSEGIDSQQAAADQFGISVATLRRRLEEEHTSFREIVIQSRLKRAEMMLRRGATVTQVSEQLGYSDVRAFNRAFRKVRGVTPSAFLRRHADTGQAAL